MRFTLAFIFMLISQNSFAWECSHGYSTEDPPEKHIEIASDVIYGQVVSGSFNTDSNDIKFELKVAKSFKGNLGGIVKLKTNSYSFFGGIDLGMNYLIYLYGSKEIDFCGIVIPYTKHATDIDSLGVFAEEPGYLKAAIEYAERRP